jgi:hypothetical protein
VKDFIFKRQKNLVCIVKFVFIVEILFSELCMGQVSSDTNRHFNYKFHPNFKVQEGYGVTLGWINGNGKIYAKEKLTRDIYTIGITKTTISQSGHNLTTENALLEFNKIGNKTLFGLTVGGDLTVMIFVFGLQFNYTTDFSANNVLALRPRIGFSFVGLGINLAAMAEYDFHIIKPKLDYFTNSLGELQYTFGMFEKK